jgi:hypothetical protein
LGAAASSVQLPLHHATIIEQDTGKDEKWSAKINHSRPNYIIQLGLNFEFNF